MNGGLAVAADEEFLPFAPASFDLVVASLSLHWVNDLPGALIQLRHALRPDGLLLASLPALGTLDELRRALTEAEAALTGGAAPRVSPFPDLRDCAGLLQRAGFTLPVADVEEMRLLYADPFALLRDLRAAGETNALRAARPPRAAARAVPGGAGGVAAAGRPRAGDAAAGDDDRVGMTAKQRKASSHRHSSAKPAARPSFRSSMLSCAISSPSNPAHRYGDIRGVAREQRFDQRAPRRCQVDLHRPSVVLLPGPLHQPARLQLVHQVRHVAGAGQHLSPQLALAQRSLVQQRLQHAELCRGQTGWRPAEVPPAPAPPARRAAASRTRPAPRSCAHRPRRTAGRPSAHAAVVAAQRFIITGSAEFSST